MRYLPLTESDRQLMLIKIGANSVEDLFSDVPVTAHLKGPIAGLPNHQSEHDVERLISAFAKKNVPTSACPAFLGAGAYRHHIPASVDHLLLRGEFLTSYTPYQPEVSQGTLQYLFEFQTQVALLTQMDVANASMYDGPTACAEAVMMANRVTKRSKAILSGNLHPHYSETITTLARTTGFNEQTLSASPDKLENLTDHIDENISCVVVQNPDFFGRLHDYSTLAQVCHAKGALLIIAVTEVVSLGLIKPPGAMDADIVVAEGQGLGNGLGFGGPYLGLFACKEKYIRQMPGRLCGQTVDAEGNRGFVLTLSTREQHIRREKATSNICTNSGLCALGFTIHLTLLGESGLKSLAEINHDKACDLAERLNSIKGCKIVTENFFNEFTLSLPKSAADVVDQLAQKPILAGVPVSRLYPSVKELENLLLVTATELTTDQDMDELVDALQELCQ